VLQDPDPVRRRIDSGTAVALPAAVFASTFIVRVRGVSRHFWLLGDQIRDWSIALGSFTSLPLVGPPTHVHGYTIGPAFYWILWTIRVIVGPWFQNLPHGGGIAQAAIQSAADALLLVAVWKRTQSIWIALTAIVLVSTGSFDVAISAIIWNPTMGSALAKTAIALILLEWHRASLWRVGITAAVAWSAVHAYTGAVFVAVGVFGALVADPLARGDRRAAWRAAVVVIGAVVLLQLPYAAHQLSDRSSDSGVSAVTMSLGETVSGRHQLRLGDSRDAYAFALDYLLVSPWHFKPILWLVTVCGALLAARYRREPALLSVTLVPQAAAFFGYALWLGDLEAYYYLSLMTPAVLTVVLGAAAFLPRGAVRFAAPACLAAALLSVPARLQLAATMFQMPQYRVLVSASRSLARQGQPLQSIRTAFPLPPTADPEFLFTVLGGRIDRHAPRRVMIQPGGEITYERNAP
jgi:hypothetical protein